MSIKLSYIIVYVLTKATNVSFRITNSKEKLFVGVISAPFK